MRAENPVHRPDQQSCSPGHPAVMITDQCLRFVFLLITRIAAWLHLGAVPPVLIWDVARTADWLCGRRGGLSQER